MSIFQPSPPVSHSFEVPGYRLCLGSGLDRALLVKFMQRTYAEICAEGSFAHLAQTVEQYFSQDTPLWWVYWAGLAAEAPVWRQEPPPQPIGCLWLGNAIDQANGSPHAHVFLVYVTPEHRRRGVGSALMRYAEGWAKARGDRQMGLQVFQSNHSALQLYQGLGYQTQSLWMVKPLAE
jgi:GNAT superfamily N-acetyltransferase